MGIVDEALFQSEKDVIEEEKGTAQELTSQDVGGEPVVPEAPVVVTKSGMERTLTKPIVDVSDYNPISGITGKKIKSDQEIIEKERVNLYKPIPNLNEVLTNNIDEVNGEILNPDMVQRAKNGDEKAIEFLTTFLDEQALKKQSGDTPTIFQTPSGQIDTDAITAAIGSPPVDYTITDSQFDRVKARATLHGKINAKLKFLEVGKIDANVRSVLADYYTSGKFHKETFRRIGTLTQGLAQIPFLAYLAGKATGAMWESGLGDQGLFDKGTKTFSEAWAERSGDISATFAGYKNVVEKFIPNMTWESILNADLKERYIEEFGQPAYDELYALPDGKGNVVHIPMVSPQQAREILNFGFNELPLIAQFAALLPENIGIGSAFAQRRALGGIEQMKRVNKARQLDTKGLYKDYDDVALIRVLEIADKNKLFGGQILRTFKARLGEKFGYTGGIGDVHSVLKHKAALDSLDTQILTNNKLIDDISSGLNKIDDLDTVILAGENLAMQKMKLKSSALFTGRPYFAAALKAEVSITAGQAAGRYILGQEYGWVSPEAGEAIGAITTALSINPLQLTLKTAGFAIRKFDDTVPVLSSIGRIIEDFPSNFFSLGQTQGKKRPNLFRGMFIDRRFDAMEAELGAGISNKQKSAIRLLAKATANMDKSQREMVWQSIDEYKQLRRRMVKPFLDDYNKAKQNSNDIEYITGLETELREAEDVFSLSFAHVTGLAPLIALESVAAGKLNMRKLNLKETVDHQIEAENTLAIAQVAMTKFKKLLNAKYDRGGYQVDMDNREFQQNFINNFQKASDAQSLRINERKIEYLKLLDDYKTNVMIDPNHSLDKDSLTKLVELETVLTHGTVVSIEKQRQTLTKVMLEFNGILKKRQDAIYDMRGSTQARFMQAKHVEEAYDAKMNGMKLLAKAGYAPADKYALDNLKYFDVSDSVLSLIELRKAPLPKGTTKNVKNIREADNSSALRSFFSAGGTFLKGRDGRDLLKSFNEMAYRNLTGTGKGQLGLEPDELNKMLQIARQPEIENSKGVMVINEDYLSTNASFLDFALHHSSKGTNGSTFKPFQATPSELEDVRRHLMRKASLYAKQGKKDLEAQYNNQIDVIDNIYNTQDKVYGKLIQDGRDNYRDFIYDDKRKGSSKYKIDNSLVNRPDRVSPIEIVPGVTFKHNWDALDNPINWHEDIAKNMLEVMAGTANAETNMMLKFGDFQATWADRVKTNGGTKVAFDLRTEEGLNNFNLSSKMLEMQVLEHFGASRQKILEDIFNRNIKEKITDAKGNVIEVADAKKATEYDFSQIRKLERAEAQLLVPVVRGTDESGNAIITHENLFDLTDVIAKERDIMNLMRKSSEVRAEHEKLAIEVNSMAKTFGVRGDGIIAIEQRSVKDLEMLSGTAKGGALAFYQKYFLNGTLSNMEDLKTQFLSLRTVDNGPIKAIPMAQAEEEFKQGMIYMAMNGLMAVGEFGTAGTRTLKGFGGRKHTVSVMANVSGFADQLLRDKNTREILGSLFESEHIERLQDIARFLEFSSGASLVKYAKTGIIRGISGNELISRSFNLARGMVSPTYVAAELAIRIASQHGIELVGMAARSKQAADLLHKVMKDPESLSKQDIKAFAALTKTYVATELARTGNKTPLYTGVELGKIQTATQYYGDKLTAGKDFLGGALDSVWKTINKNMPLENQSP